MTPHASFQPEYCVNDLRYVLDYANDRKALYSVWRAQCLVDYAIRFPDDNRMFKVARGVDPNAAFDSARLSKLSLDESTPTGNPEGT